MSRSSGEEPLVSLCGWAWKGTLLGVSEWSTSLVKPPLWSCWPVNDLSGERGALSTRAWASARLRGAEGSPRVASLCRVPQANFGPGDRTRGVVTHISSSVQEEDPRSGRGEGQRGCRLWGSSCGRASFSEQPFPEECNGPTSQSRPPSLTGAGKSRDPRPGQELRRKCLAHCVLLRAKARAWT